MLLYVRDENLLYINNRQQIDCHSHGLLSDRRWSISADLVQSRFTQIGSRSVSELESVLTLLVFNTLLAAVNNQHCYLHCYWYIPVNLDCPVCCLFPPVLEYNVWTDSWQKPVFNSLTQSAVSGH